ncbi:hypothetical protein CNYM01_02841 [Colletotrichum nymphaeae SA-01]|uniref:Uncharacterized protein n=1 Tax=Colletotrichum nymphaeae SA-01 TaxID=1460502 RepID=A0A135TH68_9PEZI|nr:hypothetical protein CNYM01_02841 [Colletotrichum nymphaeae SA-01]
MASRTLEGQGQPILERLSLHLRRECCSDLFDERRDVGDRDYLSLCSGSAGRKPSMLKVARQIDGLLATPRAWQEKGMLVVSRGVYAVLQVKSTVSFDRLHNILSAILQVEGQELDDPRHTGATTQEAIGLSRSRFNLFESSTSRLSSKSNGRIRKTP